MGEWCQIESDPGVFSDMLRQLGVGRCQVDEIYCLDKESFDASRPVHGLIFLFRYKSGEPPAGQLAPDHTHVYFAQQVIQDACATQAIVNLLMNLPEDVVDLGPVMSELKEFSAAVDPATRGLCLSNSERIRTVHNSYSRQHLFEMVDLRGGEKEAPFHFVTYVPVLGRVYELDGLREAPIDLGAIGEKQDWLDVVLPSIRQRVAKYEAGDIHFNLMVLTEDRRAALVKELSDIVQNVTDADVQAKEAARLQALIDDEDAKIAKSKAENARRRHNYVPFVIELLKILAEEGKLEGLVEDATKRAVDRLAKKPRKKASPSKE